MVPCLNTVQISSVLIQILDLSFYLQGRSSEISGDLLKVKQFHSAEIKVDGIKD